VPLVLRLKFPSMRRGASTASGEKMWGGERVG
jgi:hypothetical protein